MARRKKPDPPPPTLPDPPAPGPAAEDMFIGPSETTDVCWRCRRTVRRSMMREVRTPAGRDVRECRRFMAPSCAKIAGTVRPFGGRTE